MSDLESFMKSILRMAPMEEKKEVFKFAARCRDQDRQYEINNNAELDNGVYHKFVYSSKDDMSKQGPGNNEGREQLLSRNSTRQKREGSLDMLQSGRPPKKPVNPSIAAEREALKADIRKKIKRPEEKAATIDLESIGELTN